MRLCLVSYEVVEALVPVLAASTVFLFRYLGVTFLMRLTGDGLWLTGSKMWSKNHPGHMILASIVDQPCCRPEFLTGFLIHFL